MTNLDNIFESIYQESHQSHMTEIAVLTIAKRIKKHIIEGDVVSDATRFGKMFAEKPYENTLQPDTSIFENAVLERFSPLRDNASRNTILAETYYNNVVNKFGDTNKPKVKQWFEAFYKEIKGAGVPFLKFTQLNVA